MGRIWVCAGQKGGSGKTTVALNAACELAERGGSCLLVDADPQGSASTIIKTSPTWARLPTIAHMPRDAGQLRVWAAEYETVIVDCPPGDQSRMARVLRLADLAIVPCSPSTFDVWSLDATIRGLAETEIRWGVCVNRFSRRTIIGRGFGARLRREGIPVWRQTLGYRAAYQQSPASGLGVTQYRPHSVAADEIRGLVKELRRAR